MKRQNKCFKELKIIKDLTFRVYPSEIHKKVFVKGFGEILEYHSISIQLIECIRILVMIGTEEVLWDESGRYLETGEPARNKLAMNIFPYARAIY